MAIVPTNAAVPKVTFDPRKADKHGDEKRAWHEPVIFVPRRQMRVPGFVKFPKRRLFDVTTTEMQEHVGLLPVVFIDSTASKNLWLDRMKS